MIAKNDKKEPEFKDVYVPAFCALMLHKLGGMQQITIELLESWPKELTPIIEYNPDKKSFIMKTPAYHKKKMRKRSVIRPRRKLIIPN